MELGIGGYSDPNLRRITAVESNALHPADLHAAQVFSGADRETRHRGARDEIVGNSAKMPTFVRLLAESTGTNGEARGFEETSSPQFSSNSLISMVVSVGSNPTLSAKK